MDPQQSSSSIPEDSKQRNVSSRPAKEAPAGILRLDASKGKALPPEFKISQKEQVCRQSSIDRLSVKFANELEDSPPKRMQQLQEQLSSQHQQDRVQFPEEAPDCNVSDEDDYSASVNAIIQRRVSTRRSKKLSRRPSSPFVVETPGAERRRSSVFTTSSGDTAITVDENAANEVTQDEIFENIKLHKEVLSNVKMQPWNMRKKLKLVDQAKTYIKKHEGQLQERLAQSHSTKDMLARWNIVLIKKWQKWKRELTNMSMWFIPWELKIKEIESHFGSVVASYFIFLRWLFWVNIVIAVVIISFVTIPEIVTADSANAETVKERKSVLPEEKYNSTNFLTLWDFEGVFKYSPLFYGYYSIGSKDHNDSAVFANDGRGYRVPFAYFVTGLIVYAYSFFATLRKMAENSRMSKRSEKEDECVFSWKLFTAWDYMVGNAETAHNRMASIVMGFKEALVEEAEKKRESRNWKVICFRVLINTLVIGLLGCSAFAVVIVVKRSQDTEAGSTVWRRNEITVVMTLITFFFPMLFEVLGFAEQYHPRKQLRLQLGRIMILNLLNLYSLIFALFDKIDDMQGTLNQLKMLFTNQSTDVPTYTIPLPSVATQEYSSNVQCLCSENYVVGPQSTTLASTLATMAFAIVAKGIGNYDTEPYLNESQTSTLAFDYTEDFNYTETSTDFSGTTESYWNFTQESTTEYFEDYLNSTLGFDNYTSSDDYLNATTTEESSTYETTFFTQFNLTTLPPEEEQRFDVNLSSHYEEITSTIAAEVVSSTTEISTTEGAPTADYCTLYCLGYVATKTETSTSPATTTAPLNYTTKAILRSHCWETMFGQELIKLTVMDLIMTGLSVLTMDFLRGIFVRFMNRCWCWDLEKRFPQYGDFKVAENILHLVNNQGMVWMGMFFSPGLVVLNVVKLYVLMYLRTWAVLTCNVPHEVIFRASRSNNFYYFLLLVMLFLCVLPVGYAIVWIEPSWHCGPFSGYQKIFHIFTRTIRANVPPYMHRVLDYVASPGIVIPLLLLLVLIIYYMVSLTKALKEANNDLKVQLRRERTEERRKMFQMAVRRRRGGSGESTDQTPFSKWKKLLGNLPSTRSHEDTCQESDDIAASQREDDREDKAENKGKVFFTKLIKKALGKTSISDDEQDGTDTDQHESLPYDNVLGHKPVSKTESSESSDFRKLPSIVSKWTVRRPAQRQRTDCLQENKEVTSEPVSLQQVTVHRDPSPKPLRANTSSKKNAEKETPFLKKIIDAKKLGVFDEKVEQVHHERKKPAQRQDSSSSIWSDNIPVITISKTYSDEKILTEKANEAASIERQNELNTNNQRKFVFKDDGETSSSSDEDEPIASGSSAKLQTYLSKLNEPAGFRPRVKCVLKKQATAIDEDVIIHFGRDLEKVEADKQAILDLVDAEIGDAKKDQSWSSSEEKSTSEETELKDDNSVDTILNAPLGGEDGDEGEGNGEDDVLQLMGGSAKSSSRSQTESSSYYQE